MLSRFRSWYANQSFSKKIFYSNLFFCILPFLMSTLISSLFFVNVLYMRTKSSILDSNNKISILMKNKLSQYEYIVNNLIRDPSFLCIVQEPDDVMTTYEINRYLNEKMAEMQVSIPEMKEFVIYTDSDYENDSFRPLSEVAQNKGLSYALRQADATWYAQDGNVFVAYPIRGLYNAVPLGLITLRLDMRQLVDSFTQLSLDEYAVYMYGPTGDALYSKEAFSFEIGRITERMLEGSDSTFRTAGRRFLIARADNSSNRIHIYCIVPENSVYGPIWNYLSIPLVMWLIGLLLVVNLCLFLSKSIGRRVRLLEAQMTQVSNGDLTVFPPENVEDEIGNISRFCSQALVKLNKLIDDNYLSQIRLQDAKNKALLAQIKPHFLYNTLNLIAGQAIISENQVIADVVTQLSNYYRTTLNKGKNLIPIRDEILNVQSYGNLQTRLHDGRFRIEYRVDNAVYDYATINLCLQPLVENAIEHGVSHLPEGEGVIRVSAALQEDTIVFSVTNNGAQPMTEDLSGLIGAKNSGYGLKNIQDRIHIVFGEAYGLSLSCRNTWFTARLCIPALPPEEFPLSFDSDSPI